MRNLLITSTAVLALSAMSINAGGLGEPIMEPEVVEAATSSSAGGIIVPILLLLLIAAALSNSPKDVAPLPPPLVCPPFCGGS